jgi:outer membrane protein TolC
MRGRYPRAGHLLVSATLLAGCAVGPDFHPPASPRVSGYTPRPLSATESAPSRAGAPQRFVQGMDIPGQWWTLFRSPALNELIARSLKANSSIDAVQAALRQATETMYAQQGVRSCSKNIPFHSQTCRDIHRS